MDSEQDLGAQEQIEVGGRLFTLEECGRKLMQLAENVERNMQLKENMQQTGRWQPGGEVERQIDSELESAAPIMLRINAILPSLQEAADSFDPNETIEDRLAQHAQQQQERQQEEEQQDEQIQTSLAAMAEIFNKKHAGHRAAQTQREI